jgi:NAD(P)-dependent dehydrogenase (short-subunit alcohol dehydrogenase family)
MNIEKVAITGHSKGLGSILFERYSKKGLVVLGASRQNGYDLNNSQTLNAFCEQIKDYHLLINNAPGGFQRHVLRKMFHLWRGKDKIIMNVGSRATQFSVSAAMDYGTEKAALDFYVRSAQHFGQGSPHVLLIRPGYFGGDRSKNKEVDKIDPNHVADLIELMIDNVSKYKILDLVVIK